MFIFEVFLHLKGPLVANFNERCAITSRKYIAKQGINILKVSQKHKLLRLHFSVFCFRIIASIIFEMFYPCKTLVATVNEICALTSRKYIVERSKNLWKTKIVLLILPRFFFREYTVYYKLLLFIQINFLDFFNFKKHFGGYFQGNACTYFQKICAWIRYTNAKFVTDKLIFSIALLHFCFRKKALLILIFQTFLPLKEHLVATFCENVCTHFQKIYIWTRHQHSKFVRETSTFSVALLRFCFREIAWKSKFS